MRLCIFSNKVFRNLIYAYGPFTASRDGKLQNKNTVYSVCMKNGNAWKMIYARVRIPNVYYGGLIKFITLLVRESLDHRKEQVRQRRLRLTEARALHEEDLLTEFDVGSHVAEDKYALLKLYLR